MCSGAKYGIISFGDIAGLCLSFGARLQRRR